MHITHQPLALTNTISNNLFLQSLLTEFSHAQRTPGILNPLFDIYGTHESGICTGVYGNRPSFRNTVSLQWRNTPNFFKMGKMYSHIANIWQKLLVQIQLLYCFSTLAPQTEMLWELAPQARHVYIPTWHHELNSVMSSLLLFACILSRWKFLLAHNRAFLSQAIWLLYTARHFSSTYIRLKVKSSE